MRIQRDYSRPFFSNKRRHGTDPRLIFILGLLIGGIVIYTYTNLDSLQYQALEMANMAPTATPFASEYAAQGEQRYAQGDIRGSLASFEQAAMMRSDDINYVFEYGWMLLENDLYDEAMLVADQAIRIAPGDARGYAIKGRALMWSDPTEAILASIQGTDIAPNYAPLLAIQGVAYTNLGRWQEGLRKAEEAVALDPTDAFVQRSYYYPLVYVGRYQSAIEALEAAISINPNVTAPYFELANLYTIAQVNEPTMAIALYNRITEMEPNNAKAYLRLCETYARVDEARFDIAQPYCDKAIEIDETYASAYRQRGQMQYNRRNYEGAIESFEECRVYGSTEIECWYLRGLAYYWLNECDNAWSWLNEARLMGQAQGLPENQGAMGSISQGLENVTLKCPGYTDLELPTAIPPTAVPPTPIGGFG